MKREQKFLSDLGRSIKADGGFFFKIPDSPNYGEMRFQIEKPFDVIIFWAGHGIALEGKYLTTKTVINLNCLRKGQIKGLRRSHANGACSYVVVGLKLSNGLERAYFFTWPMVEQKTRYIAEDLKKVFHIDKRHKEEWDLRPFKDSLMFY